MAHLVNMDIRIEDERVQILPSEYFDDAAEGTIRELAALYFASPIEVALRLEEGSLRIAMAIAGAIFSTYYFVGNYKAFKDGLVEICKDMNEFGDGVCDGVIKKIHVPRSKVVKQEVKVQTPRTLLRAIEELEKIDQSEDSILLGKYPRRLARVVKQLDRALGDVSEEERNAIVNSVKFENLPPIPELPKDAVDVEGPRVARRERAQRGPPRIGMQRRKPVLKYRRRFVVEVGRRIGHQT